MLTEWKKPEHTYSLRPRCRWLTATLPRQSSWQTGRDQWLLPVVQDFSPPPGFDLSHTAKKKKEEVKKICCSKTNSQQQEYNAMWDSKTTFTVI